MTLLSEIDALNNDVVYGNTMLSYFEDPLKEASGAPPEEDILEVTSNEDKGHDHRNGMVHERAGLS